MLLPLKKFIIFFIIPIVLLISLNSFKSWTAKFSLCDEQWTKWILRYFLWIILLTPFFSSHYRTSVISLSEIQYSIFKLKLSHFSKIALEMDWASNFLRISNFFLITNLSKSANLTLNKSFHSSNITGLICQNRKVFGSIGF